MEYQYLKKIFTCILIILADSQFPIHNSYSIPYFCCPLDINDEHPIIISEPRCIYLNL